MRKEDKAYYFFLVIILSAGITLVVLLYPNKFFQLVAAIFLCILYGAYGIIHHFLEHSLVGKIVVEYILIAMLGIALSLFLFKGGFGF